MKLLLSFVLCLALCSCQTTSTQTTKGPSVADKAAAFANSPSGQAIQKTLVTAAFNAATQYATYGKVEAQQVVAATLDGSAQGIRSLVATPQADSPGAIAMAVNVGSGIRATDNTVAPIVAGVVTKQIQKGIDPAQALENAATVMNKAAAKTRARQSK